MKRQILPLALLTIVAAASDAGATIRSFALTWSGASFSNSAHALGVIQIDDTLLANPGANDTSSVDFVPALDIAVSGASSGNGRFHKSDFGFIILDTGGATLDLSTELVGQPTPGDPWGTSQPGNTGGDFNLFGLGSPTPVGTYYFELTTNGSAGDPMLLTSFAPFVCNVDGTVSGTEQCDDGNTFDNDGCTGCVIDDCWTCTGSPSMCSPASPGAACSSDGNDCTADTCDGAGLCGHATEAAGTPCTEDFDACTNDVCDAGGTCTHPAITCNDSNPCTQDSCDSGFGCLFTASPATMCVTGDSASIQLKKPGDSSKNQIKWKLSKADLVEQADLGDPTTTTGYTMCVFDLHSSVPTLATSLSIPASSLWTSKDPKGFAYKDKAASHSGVTKASLKTGAAGKSSVSVLAKGASVPMPTPFSTSYFEATPGVMVQLMKNDGSKCWTSEFDTATKNDVTGYSAKTP